VLTDRHLASSKQHTHTVRLYDRRTQYIVQSMFNIICFDNHHNRITYYFYTVSLHCFTRKSNRFNCILQQTPQNPFAFISEMKWLITNNITPHPLLKQVSTCAATVLASTQKHGTFHIAFKL